MPTSRGDAGQKGVGHVSSRHGRAALGGVSEAVSGMSSERIISTPSGAATASLHCFPETLRTVITMSGPTWICSPSRRVMTSTLVVAR